MRIDDVSLEEHPEYFADFDDSTIRYISENIEDISDEDLQKIIEKELSKYH